MAKWFVGGKTNVSYNCLDIHLQTQRRNKAALIWEGEPGDTRVLTYQMLHDEVCRFANVLKKLGVGRGDVVSIYMPLVPELAIAMLACARIGAIHCVIFGGFSAEAIAERNNNASAKVILTADGGWRRGKQLPLKENVDVALQKSPTVEKCVVLRRTGNAVTMTPGRDFWWHDLIQEVGDDCPAEPLDSETPLFILYTSGSTGKPKGIMHTTAGYNLFAKKTTEWVFDIRDDDIYWCTADMGWITGHSYVVYGPLSAGATVFIYEGAPDAPDCGRWWQMIEKHRINILYTAPTAIRTFIKWGDPLAREVRPVEPAAAGQRGRRHQPRGLDVVSREDRRRPLPDRRYLVADGDRRHHDEPAARGHDDQARQLHAAAARRVSRDRRRGPQAGRHGQRRLAGDRQALARHAAGDLGRRRALQAAILDRGAAQLSLRRQRPPR